MMKYIIALVLCWVSQLEGYSQITTNEKPMSLQLDSETMKGNRMAKTMANTIMELSAPELSAIIAEDSLNDTIPSKGYRVGVKIPVSINSSIDGQWTELSDGSKIWLLTLSVPNAKSLDLTFSRFWLPEGGKFFVYNPITSETIGAITSEYLQGSQDMPAKFSTGIVKGDTLSLEYYQPNDIEALPIIEVSGVYYGYRLFSVLPNENRFGYSGGCQVNVNCDEGDNWQDEKNAVAKIYLKGPTSSEFCSGFLVNNTSYDFTPYVLSANHCAQDVGLDAVNAPDASESIFYWGYETANCNDNTEPTCYSTVGATLVANNSSYADFALYRLIQDPKNLQNYNPYYLGWDRSGISGTGGVGIHHPRGDVKKISTYSCVPAPTDYYDNNAYSYGTHWRINWTSTLNGHGTTETGSSGSPLINNYHQVIGQLHGGDSSCSLTNAYDWYGRFNVSWTGNGSIYATRRLKDWLDPIETNQTEIDGHYYTNLSIIGQAVLCGSETYSINGLPDGYTVSWSFDSANSNLDSLILQDTPILNECTISTNSGDLISATLTANIRYNGQVIATRTKYVYNVIFVGGAYSQVASASTPAISTTAFTGGTPVPIYKGAVATIISGAMANKNITYSGAQLSYWNYTSAGIVNLEFLETAGHENVTICAQEPNSCLKYVIYVTTIDDVALAPLSLNIYQDKISLTESDSKNDALETKRNITRKVEVINSVTGKIVYSGFMTERILEISTEGWNPGVYILSYEGMDEVMSHKILIK